MKTIKVTKLLSIENAHDKNSTFGESKPFYVGRYESDPVIGERFIAWPIDFIEHRGINTSPVTKIIDENTFETLNSVYKWEYLN